MDDIKTTILIADDEKRITLLVSDYLKAAISPTHRNFLRDVGVKFCRLCLLFYYATGVIPV